MNPTNQPLVQVDVSNIKSFRDLNLSRAVQVGLTSMGMEKPTPIQVFS